MRFISALFLGTLSQIITTIQPQQIQNSTSEIYIADVNNTAVNISTSADTLSTISFELTTTEYSFSISTESPGLQHIPSGEQGEVLANNYDAQHLANYVIGHWSSNELFILYFSLQL